jgi:hypothetical protein
VPQVLLHLGACSFGLRLRRLHDDLFTLAQLNLNGALVKLKDIREDELKPHTATQAELDGFECIYDLGKYCKRLGLTGSALASSSPTTTPSSTPTVDSSWKPRAGRE